MIHNITHTQKSNSAKKKKKEKTEISLVITSVTAREKIQESIKTWKYYDEELQKAISKIHYILI